MLSNLLSSQRIMAGLALLVAMFLWSSSYVALKIAVESYHPIVMVAGRMLVGVVVLGLCWKWLYTAPKGGLTRRDWLMLALLGLLEPSLYLLLEGYAIQLTSASQAGMIVAAQPVFVILLARVLLKERFRRRTMAGFVVALWGVAWMCADGEISNTAPNPMLGNILETLAILCAAMYVIVSKNLSPACSPLMVTGAQVVSGLVFFVPMTLLPGVPLPTEFPLLPTLAVLYLGVMVSLVSFFLFNFAIVRLPASQTGAFLNLVPLMTLLLGVLVMGDTLTVGQWIASGLVMCGVVLSQSAPALSNPSLSTPAPVAVAMVAGDDNSGGTDDIPVNEEGTFAATLQDCGRVESDNTTRTTREAAATQTQQQFASCVSCTSRSACDRLALAHPPETCPAV